MTILRQLGAAVLGVLLLAGAAACTSTHPTAPARPPSSTASRPAADVARWWISGTVSDDWKQLGTDTTAVSSAEQAADTQSVTWACAALKADAAAFQVKDLPAPDAVLDQLLAQSATLMVRSADACLAGNQAEADALAEQAATAIDAVTERVRVLP